MRTKYSIKNSISATMLYIFNVLIGFISQTFFIKFLNIEYLGLSNVYINILSIIQIFELGIGNLIIYHLYEPIAKNDVTKIKSLLSFYRKWCYLLSIIIVILSIAILPFLKLIVGNITIDTNIYIVYFLFMISNIICCFYNYNMTLLYTSQKNYIVSIIHIFYLIILNSLQLFILYKTSNYYLYLIIKILFQIIETVIVNILNRKIFVNYFNKIKCNCENVKKIIFKDIRPLIYHKLNNAIINNGDNVFLSIFLGLEIVGKYSNYYLLINYLNTLFGQIIVAAGASVGNLLVLKNKQRNYDVFKRLNFLNFWLASLSGMILLSVVQPFIEIWLGKEYLMSIYILVGLVICHFLRTMRCSYNLFYSNSGIWRKDLLSPIIEIIIYITSAIILINLISIMGIIVAGIVCDLTLWLYTYPKYVYNKIFDKEYVEYIKENIFYFITFIFLLIVTMIFQYFIIVNNIYLNLLINGLFSIIVSNVLFLIIFKNNNEFKYFIQLLLNVFKK